MCVVADRVMRTFCESAWLYRSDEEADADLEQTVKLLCFMRLFTPHVFHRSVFPCCVIQTNSNMMQQR
ncbi:Hypothetical protein, putative, partial [Bodo saltans]